MNCSCIDMIRHGTMINGQWTCTKCMKPIKRVYTKGDWYFLIVAILLCLIGFMGFVYLGLGPT